MKKNIILTALALSMLINPFSAFAETDDETNTDDNQTHIEDDDTETDDNDTTGDDGESQEEEEEEHKTYTLTFLDFDGKVMQTIEVADDEQIDYSQIDVSELHSFVDKYTEQAFNSWSSQPEYISEDTTIQALWKRGSISADGTPSKTEYYSKGADIDFTGLSVFITLETQTPETDDDGNFIVETQENNIISSCYAEKSLAELFSEEKTATVNVIPNGDDKTIFSYEITLFDSLGDANGDNEIDAVDASFVLEVYAGLSTGAESSLSESQRKVCDINQDGIIDAIDATYILMYYAQASTNGGAVWENLIEKQES